MAGTGAPPSFGAGRAPGVGDAGVGAGRGRVRVRVAERTSLVASRTSTRRLAAVPDGVHV